MDTWPDFYLTMGIIAVIAALMIVVGFILDYFDI